jgi:hypothetical protein
VIGGRRKRFSSWEINEERRYKAMNYEKPEVVILGPALSAVQGSGKGSNTKDNGQATHTPPAYEADE